MINATCRQVLQDDEDFLVEVIKWEGNQAVRKSVKPTTRQERRQRLKNEAYGLGFFEKLSNENPNLNFCVPKLFKATDDFIITEYIDSPAVGDNPENLDKLAKLLAGIDRMEPYGETKITPHFDYQNIRSRFQVWIEQPLLERLVTQRELDRANHIIDRREQYLRPRLTHGDLSSYDHAFLLSDGKIALVDLEVFTPCGARYYDVARTYTRLYSRAAATQTSKHFLRSFLRYARKIDHQTEQLQAIFTQRSVGMLRDACIDSRKGSDYRDRARDFFEKILTEDFTKLI